MQVAYAPPSIRHSSVSLAWCNANVAAAEATVPVGPESMVGSAGATVSAVHVREVVADVLSTESFARTWNVCEPWPRPV